MVITAVNSITPLGYNAEVTAASFRAGISRLVEANDYFDSEGKPIISSSIEGISDDEEEDEVIRIGDIAKYCLEMLLENYFQFESGVERETHLLLGIPPMTRPGPQYQRPNKELANKLVEITKRWTKNAALKVVTSGNASVIRCIEIAKKILYNNPQSLCIIGGVDSLLALETLDWFEKAERLKSETFGRNQAFSPGEAVGFMIIETKEKANRNKRNRAVPARV